MLPGPAGRQRAGRVPCGKNLSGYAVSDIAAFHSCTRSAIPQEEDIPALSAFSPLTFPLREAFRPHTPARYSQIYLPGYLVAAANIADAQQAPPPLNEEPTLDHQSNTICNRHKSSAPRFMSSPRLLPMARLVALHLKTARLHAHRPKTACGSAYSNIAYFHHDPA